MIPGSPPKAKIAHSDDSSRPVSQATWLLLALSVLAPILIAGLWGDVYADAAYTQLQHARAIAKGADMLDTLNFSPTQDSPLYTLLLSPATKSQASVAPTVALTLSALGWAAAITAWFLTGLALDRPTFSTAALILALHPLQAQVLGLESGLVLGLWGLATLLLVLWHPGPTKGRTPLAGWAALITMLALTAAQPIMLSFVAPLFIYGLLGRGRSSPNLAHIAVSIAIGAACYALACVLDGTHLLDNARLMTPLLAALQLLVAAGFATLAPRTSWLAGPSADRRALQRGILSLGLIALAFWQGRALWQEWRMRPTDRLALYKDMAQWLHDHSLPTETVGAQQASGLLGYLSERASLALPDTSKPIQAPALLASIIHAPPDYCVALNSLAWRDVRSLAWFQERYRQVHQLANPYDSASPLTLYRYAPSPFDSGETVSTTLRFVPDAGEQIELLNYRLDTRRLTPGAPLHLTLNWRAPAAVRRALFPVVRLVDAASGQVWTQTENLAWRVGAQFGDHYALLPPAGLPPGDYVLDLALYTERDPVNPRGVSQPVLAGDQDGPLRAEPIILAQVYRPPNVSVAAPEPDHTLDLAFGDKIALIGYDAPEHIAPGETLRVALYWHALQPVPLDYKIFVHLQASDGAVLAQDDSHPVQWAYPTTRWQPGEYVRDEHILTLDPSAPRADYVLSMGMYDPATNTRAVIHDAAGNEIADGRAILLQIQVR